MGAPFVSFGKKITLLINNSKIMCTFALEFKYVGN